MSQLADEQSNFGDPPDGPPSFGGLFWAIFFVNLFHGIAGTATLWVLGVRLEWDWPGDLDAHSIVMSIIYLDAINIILSLFCAYRILTVMGLSRSGKTVAVQGRTVAVHEGEVADDEVVEVRYRRSLFTGLGMICLAFCLLSILILAVLPHDPMKGFDGAYVLVAYWGLGAGYFFYVGSWGKPRAWANASGITGYPMGLYLVVRRLRFVPWSRVASCEIDTLYDTFGNFVAIRPVLKGFDNEALLTLDLLLTKPEDQERLLKYIQAKLPKLKAEPLEW